MRHIVTIDTGAIARFYTRPRAEINIAALAADLDRRLAARKAGRTKRTKASKKGWRTRRQGGEA